MSFLSDLIPILLKSAAQFSFDILTFHAICSRLVIQTLRKLHGELYGKKCESTSDKLHSILYTFTFADTSYIMQTFRYNVSTLYSSVKDVFFYLSCKSPEGYCSDVISDVILKSTKEDQNGRPSALYLKLIQNICFSEWTSGAAFKK